MYILLNEKTSFDFDYEFKNLLVRINWGFCWQQMQIQV